ncbi:MAG: aminoglycoside 3'-phosphotransferase [Ruminococcaceae bacterium]|nr:aminoglycoside 3'-phosphotransferase [Oscillospiraceae bacterium]
MMERKLTQLDIGDLPSSLRPFAEGATVYDSSCSKAARVYFLDKGEGFYLKKSANGSLQKEAAMTEFFHTKGLAPEVIAFESSDYDWMLTKRALGEDCIAPMYLSGPQRLCDLTATLLRQLHEVDISGCPVNRTADYLTTARENYRHKRYDIHLFPDNWGYATPEEAWAEIERNGDSLRADTLLHGDYCLPNILLNNWQFSSFIDLDAAGIGDRHIDLFWGMWSLNFNLKTDAYCQRFLDVYGRDLIEPERFRTVAAVEVFG